MADRSDAIKTNAETQELERRMLQSEEAGPLSTGRVLRLAGDQARTVSRALRQAADDLNRRGPPGS